MSFISELKSEIENDLPGEDSHDELSPGRGRSSEALAKIDNYRESGVAVIIYFKDNKWQSILILRTTYKGAHSGQVSFPGGKKEPFENSIIETAIRESEEEIGITRSNIDFLGKLTPIYIPVSNFKVEASVFHLKEDDVFVKDIKEVQEIIHYPLADLLNPDNKGVTNINISDQLKMKDVPCFFIQNHIVWGATAIILNEVKQILNRKNV